MEETKNKFIVLSYSLYDTTKGDDGNEDFFCKRALRSGMGQLCRNRYQHGTATYL